MRARKPDVAILPMLQNATNRQLERAGTGQAAGRSRRAAKRWRNQIVNFVAANKLQGVTVDFENVPKAAASQIWKHSCRGCPRPFAPHGWIIVQAAPFDDDNWPYKAYAEIVDYTLADGL